MSPSAEITSPAFEHTAARGHIPRTLAQADVVTLGGRLGARRAAPSFACRVNFTSVRVVAAGFSVLRPFSRGWMFLCLVALFLTFGFGGGTPNGAPWLIIKFSLLGLLLASLLVTLAMQIRDWLTRT